MQGNCFKLREYKEISLYFNVDIVHLKIDILFFYFYFTELMDYNMFIRTRYQADVKINFEIE